MGPTCPGWHCMAWKRGGVLLRLAPDEYIVAGSGLVLEFKKQGENKMKSSPALGEDGFASVGGKASKTENSWQGGMRAGIGSVDEVNVNEDGSLKYIRRLNGDQDHQGSACTYSCRRIQYFTRQTVRV